MEKQYISFEIQHQRITRTDDFFVVGGSKNYLHAKFDVCDDWQGENVVAVFNGGGLQPIKVEVKNGECCVPWEFLQPGIKRFYVGCYAGSRITSNSAAVDVNPCGVCDAVNGLDPTPDLYDAILAAANEAVNVANSVREDADNGVFDGEPGPPGPQGVPGEKGEKGDKGDPAEGSVLYTEQTLTPAQKAQARKNIGASCGGEDPAVAVQVSDLAAYGAAFYSTIAAAAADINAATTENADATQEDAAVAVYTDNDGSTCLALLANTDLSETVIFTQNVTVKLNGHTINYLGDFALRFSACSGVVDGRAEGSKLSKNVASVSAAMCLVEYRNGSGAVLGTQMYAVAESGTASIGGILILSSDVTVQDCTVEISAESESVTAFGVYNKGTLLLKNTVVAVRADGTSACIYALADSKATVEECKLTDSVQLTAATALVVDAGAEVTLKNTAITTTSQEYDSYCIYCRADSAVSLDGCQLEAVSPVAAALAVCLFSSSACEMAGTVAIAVSQSGSACAVRVDSGSVLNATGCTLTGDGTTGSTNDTGYATSQGIINSGTAALTDCTVFGTHTGFQASAGSVTDISGGTYEGCGHGGIYVSCDESGKFYAQNAAIRNAQYRGRFMKEFHYAYPQYMAAAVYVGCGSNIKAYFHNCILDGSGPAMIADGDGYIGAEPIRMRASSEEQNNAAYLSCCTLQGDGKICFGNSSHIIYLGRGNRVLCEANLPARLDSTTYAGQVFTSYEEE